MPKGMVIRDRDLGWRKLGKVLKDSKFKYVDVGVMVAHDARSDSASNTDLALRHEFGLGVAERSFIRGTVDEKQLLYVRFMKALSRQIVLGRITVEQALLLLGAKVEADMKRRIRAGIPPPNTASTIASKGSSTPLIDTGQLVSSIDYEVGPR